VRVPEAALLSRLAALGFSSLCSTDGTQCVAGGDSSNRAGGKTGLEDFPVRADREIGRVNDAAAFFPVSADLVGVFGNFQAVADGKRRAGLLHHLFGFVERIDRKCDDVGILVFEFFYVRLKVGDLPDAVRSPDTTIENDDGVLALEIGMDIQPAAIGRWHRVVRKCVAGTELFAHGLSLPMNLDALASDLDAAN
jgi:hypothetical protein